ncbi:hypothetical protein PR048_004867 [Dryococelus australis]|uniref:Uncharacterized protein n=1 Tax=Dryococelus australis TaxID=614101 RepID=A0ABQ9I6M5_9NEOP|nr:hypothetical protein PR048_004867 [Dryococelus australis]
MHIIKTHAKTKTLMYSGQRGEGNMTNRKISSDKDKVEWLRIQCIYFTSTNPYVMFYKYSNQELAGFFNANLNKRVQTPLPNPELLYPEERPIEEAKYKDVLSLLPCIPPMNHSLLHKSKIHHIVSSKFADPWGCLADGESATWYTKMHSKVEGEGSLAETGSAPASRKHVLGWRWRGTHSGRNKPLISYKDTFWTMELEGFKGTGRFQPSLLAGTIFRSTTSLAMVTSLFPLKHLLRYHWSQHRLVGSHATIEGVADPWPAGFGEPRNIICLIASPPKLRRKPGEAVQLLIFGLAFGRTWIRIPIRPTIFRFSIVSRNHSRRMLGRFLTSSHGGHYCIVPASLSNLLVSDNLAIISDAGAAVAERLAFSPPTKATRLNAWLVLSQIFTCVNRAGRCRWSVGFFGDLPYSHTLLFRRCSILTSITLIGSQDHAVKSRLNLFTLHSLSDMVVKYKRTTIGQIWSSESMVRAIRAVENSEMGRKGICDYIKRLESRYFGLTATDVSRLAFELVEKMG